MGDLPDRRGTWECFAHPAERAHDAFWFWNAELDPRTIRSQLREMKKQGIGSIHIHARIHLPETVGYLTERWFEMVGVTLEEATAIGMKVWIYDEAMYPSGAAGGLVAASCRDFRCKGLVCEAFRVEGECPVCGFTIPVGPDEKLVGIVAGRIVNGLLAPESFEDLTEQLHGDSLDWGCGSGVWQVMVFRQRFQNSVIRGLGYGPVPYATDLLSPAATDAFIALTHEQYYRRFAKYFGSTIAGFFTDEPNPAGRGGIVGAKPWTDEFLVEFSRRKGYELRQWLPALFYDLAERGDAVRWDYEEVLADLLDSAFYGRLNDWCREHGVCLTGHPAEFGELRHLSMFGMPGQDVVWRQVIPENPKPVMGKVTSSAAHIYGKPNAAMEVYGAYGWELTSSEMKWLADWLLVRGVDTHILHGTYYSLEGDNKYERPPDVCMGSPWWRHFRLFSDYVSRLAALVRAGRHVADIAVFDQCNHTDERVPFMLLEMQRDYDFLESRVLTGSAHISNGTIALHGEQYRVLVLPHVKRISVEAMRAIAEFTAGGGKVLAVESVPSLAAEYGSDAEVRALSAHIWGPSNTNARIVTADRRSIAAALDDWLEPDIRVSPACPHLRYLHRRIQDDDIYLLVNESVTEAVAINAFFRDDRIPEFWDAETGERRRPSGLSRDEGGVSLPLYLEPYQSVVAAFCSSLTHLNIDSGDGYLASADRVDDGSAPLSPLPRPLDLSTEWAVPDHKWELGQLVSWTEHPDLRYYSGTCRYVRAIHLPEEYCEGTVGLMLKLGSVRESAELWVNGQLVGVKMWPPFSFDLTGRLKPGSNSLEARVTNTPANEYDRKEMPSGLLGPVLLEPYRRAETAPAWSRSVGRAEGTVVR